MKSLEKGQDKILKISEQLKKEVLEPAQEEARKIIEEAKKKASQITAGAEKQAEDLIQSGRKAVEQERNVFYSSLQQASKQVLEALRQSIEHHLFNDELNKLLGQSTTNPKIIVDLITAIIKGMEKEGISGDLSAFIPKTVSPREINELMSQDILKKLKDHSVVLGDFSGGVQVKVVDKNLTIDISEETLIELISRYVRKDFRKLIFGT